MSVHAIWVDRGERFIVVLRDDSQTRVLPIIVGQFEAKAIDYELRRKKPVRPQTHDLLKTTLDQVGAEVIGITVTDLKEETYYAVIAVVKHGIRYEVDARPSDAIALALRCKAPIYVEQRVVDKACLPTEPSPGTTDVDRKFRDLIDQAGLGDLD